MKQTTALKFSWLNFLTKKRYDALLAKFGSLDDALGHIDQEVLAQLGCREETQFEVLNRLEEFDPDAYAAELAKRSITFITLEDEAYPRSLLQIPDPPVFLYAQGSLQIVDQPCIGCVGTREMSPYGKRVVEQFVPAFVRAGLTTVSGLALGIDAAVAEETMRAGAATVAVLGHGMGQIYPRANAALAKRIVESGGLLLSEFPLDQQPGKFTFPARNRIIAALSVGTVVFEAGRESGALITAELALEYGRDVFAVPGQIFDEHFAGCHYLIGAGQAKLVASPDDVLREIGVVAPSGERTQAFRSEDAEEQRVYDALTSMPQSVSDLTERAVLETAVINAKLTMLELSGAAKNIGNGMWVQT